MAAKIITTLAQSERKSERDDSLIRWPSSWKCACFAILLNVNEISVAQGFLVFVFVMLLVVIFNLVDSLGSLGFCWAYVGFSRTLLSLVFYLNLEYLTLRYHLALVLGFRDPAYLKPLLNVFRKIGHLKTHRAVWYAVQRCWFSCRRLCNAKKAESRDGFKCWNFDK